MTTRTFIGRLDRLKEHLENAISQSIDLNKSADTTKALYDFKEKRIQYIRDMAYNSFVDVKTKAAEIVKQNIGNKQNEQLAYDISIQLKFLEEFYKQPEKALPIITKMKELASGLKDVDQINQTQINFRVTDLPAEIKSEVTADIEELSKCFGSGCYRSCVILCGRILETVLHRKYFQATGQDILEKNPGIGLGNLVGKLKDKNIMFDPGLSQQIHLINQVRIFSVHKKQEAFYPTKDQTHAIILYTLDIARRVF